MIAADAKHKPTAVAPVIPPRRRQQLIKRYKISPWHQTLLYVIAEFFGLQDIRKKYVLISNYYQFRFLREASRRTGIPVSLLRYSVFPELASVLDKSINLKELKARRELCASINLPKSYEIITGKAARQLMDTFLRQEKTSELTGVVASSGYARGVVRIILKAGDVPKMRHGEILVSSMTRPEMIAAMRKAAAIVTDEGGITSHAAIVSREMGIPCILGTKQATRVLKNGDLVEVDANKGVIKIINK